MGTKGCGTRSHLKVGPTEGAPAAQTAVKCKSLSLRERDPPIEIIGTQTARFDYVPTSHCRDSAQDDES